MEEKINTLEQEISNNSDCKREKVNNYGLNIKHIRELLCIKQTTLAEEMGCSQQSISYLENKSNIDDETLEKVGAILKVPVLLIKNFDVEEIMYNIQNNYYEGSKGYVESEDNSQITNSMEMVKFAIQTNHTLYERIIRELKEEIKILKQENNSLRKNTLKS